MQIKLDNVSKRYRFEWIIKKLSFEFESNQSYVILGPNGSGKSTLMRMLSGYLTPSKGKITFIENDKAVEIEQVYKSVSYAAPYIDLIEEFTLDKSTNY
jgi:ABC-type multidrug transport system ATPase subunit